MKDAERIAALKERRPGAVEELVEEFTPPLLAAARAWGLSLPDAEEAVQDALVDSMEALKRFEGRSSFKTFLFGILYNKCSERSRKARREVAVDDVEAAFDARFGTFGVWNCLPRGPEEDADNAELRDWLKACAKGLSAEQRAAFHLKVVEGQGTSDICKILGVTTTHLGVLLFRARNKLRECLEKKWMRR
jgi:RNA polymerase sigma-70 factor (ECF subfamily)